MAVRHRQGEAWGTLARLRPRELPKADWWERKLVDDCGGYWDWGKGWERPAFLD